jgi:hypothetical protein
VDDVEIKMVLFLPRDAASVPVSRQVLDGYLETARLVSRCTSRRF